MSTYKTRIDAGLIDGFLSEKYKGSASPARFIKGGETSQAFSFEVGQDRFVIRVNRHGAHNFRKDAYAHDNFSSKALPIPEMLEIGEMGEYAFAISKRAEGDTIINFSESETDRILPKFLASLCAIHSIDVSRREGYGIIDADGRGTRSSWKEEVLSIAKQDWETRFKTTFMERSVYTSLYEKLRELAAFCPEDRFLVHGDCSFDNVLSDGQDITGVIDWAQSLYGDFLYDVAWLSFWPSSMRYADRFEQFYRQKGMPVHYRERILCYQVLIALNSLGFYAYSEQRDKYDWAKGRIASLLGS